MRSPWAVEGLLWEFCQNNVGILWSYYGCPSVVNVHFFTTLFTSVIRGKTGDGEALGSPGGGAGDVVGTLWKCCG